MALLIGAALAAAGCTRSTEAEPKIQTTSRPGIAPTPPAQGAYFGAWVGRPRSTGGGEARPDEVAQVRRFESQLGRQLDIVQTFRKWQQPILRESDTTLMDGNRFLLLSWSGGDTREIVAGRHDRLIHERARAIKGTHKPIFLRWERGMEEPGIRPRIHSAADYIAAWRHIRRIFDQERVDNVAWVWCPTAKGFGADNAPSFYPGDGQVDWICAEVYPGGNYDYRDFTEASKLFRQWAESRPKPIMIAEFGVPRAYDGRRAEWLRNAARPLQNPRIKAAVYYDSDRDSAKRRYQFSVSGDPRAVSALRQLATTPFFNPRNLPVSSG